MSLHDLNEMLYRFDSLKDGTFAARMEADDIAKNNFRNVLHEAIELSQPKEKPKHTIADHYPAGGSPEPCSFCKTFGDLEEERDNLRMALNSLQSENQRLTQGKCATADCKGVVVHDYCERCQRQLES